MSQDPKTDAWMPLYIGDWDGDTGHLSCEEDGAYGRLVRWYWRRGPLPDDDAALARIIRMELRAWKRIRPVIAQFFTVGEGVWRHKRVDAELVKWAAKKAAAQDRARQAAEKRWAGNDPDKPRPHRARRNATSMPDALLEQCPSPSPSEVDALNGQSTLRGRERADERAGGSSSLRVIEGGERAAWAEALRQAELDYPHFAKTDPDFASEIGEFIAVATARLTAMEDAA